MLYLIYCLAVTAKMLVCLSLAFVLDSEKVKTAAVAERCDCETRLRGEASRRWCASAGPPTTCSYVIGSMSVLILTNCHNMCHQISHACRQKSSFLLGQQLVG